MARAKRLEPWQAAPTIVGATFMLPNSAVRRFLRRQRVALRLLLRDGRADG